jgi:hypothetical protein
LRPMRDKVNNSERAKTSAVSKERGWTNLAVFFGDINSGVTDAASTVFRRCAANEASYGWHCSFSRYSTRFTMSVRCNEDKNSTRWNSGKLPALEHKYKEWKSNWLSARKKRLGNQRPPSN